MRPNRGDRDASLTFIFSSDGDGHLSDVGDGALANVGWETPGLARRQQPSMSLAFIQ
jgi:hypothetical protein